MKQLAYLLQQPQRRGGTPQTGQSERAGILKPRVDLTQPVERNSSTSNNSIQMLESLLSSNDTKTRYIRAPTPATPSGRLSRALSGVGTKTPTGYLRLSRKPRSKKVR